MTLERPTDIFTRYLCYFFIKIEAAKLKGEENNYSHQNATSVSHQNLSLTQESRWLHNRRVNHSSQCAVQRHSSYQLKIILSQVTHKLLRFAPHHPLHFSCYFKFLNHPTSPAHPNYLDASLKLEYSVTLRVWFDSCRGLLGYEAV
jgi:hypothetical protein